MVGNQPPDPSSRGTAVQKQGHMAVSYTTLIFLPHTAAFHVENDRDQPYPKKDK